MKFPIASRKTDPETSHEAECEITDSGKRDHQCQQVLAAIKESPASTAVELSRMHNIDRYAVSRRTADLFSKGLIFKGKDRKCHINKRTMTVWIAFEKPDPEQNDLF